MFGSSPASVNYCCPTSTVAGFSECSICTVTATSNCDNYIDSNITETVQCPITYPFYYFPWEFSWSCCRCQDHTECQPVAGSYDDNMDGVNAMMAENGTVDKSKS